MSDTKIYVASEVFTGTDLLHNYAVVVKDGVVEQVLPATTIPKNIETTVYDEGAIIAPAFMDVQIYGAAGRLLAVYPDSATVAAIYEYCKAGGAAYCMPTAATNSYEVFYNCIDAVKDYWNGGGKGVPGLHIEGPWISMEKRGAHIPEYIFSPTLEQVKQLLNYGKGVIKFITLAPEVCSPEIINYIAGEGIIISAGHSNATYRQAMESFSSNNIPAVTHLFNAMSQMQQRAPGLVGATMEHHLVMASVIPDGYHVDYANIRLAKKLMQKRLFAITDAVTETTEGCYQHTFEGDKYTANGILSGSSLTMSKAAYNLIHHVGIEKEEALRMCSLHPARLMRMNNTIGMLKPGFLAKMVALDKDMNVLEVVD
ncbi:MAG: N-acetylglucosamine-6-phosphate deacetylase [Chitinophagaceae bacterium]|jgi:N-acetylglucosamine-6-phosphate deacetylase|nr:N-acetylglucosamine-6-phosphate deacetylase [Chitinophagaceae bacterium]